MNRKEAAELSPIIKAFSEGKTILVKDKRLSDEEYSWSETDDCSFNIEKFDYRIKPETKYRPFKDAEECWAEMQKHEPFGWVKCKGDGSLGLITLIINKESIYINSIGSNSERTMREFTFCDGTPFGILEEE